MIMSVISTILVLFTLVGTALAATSDTITIKVESDGNGTLSMSPSNPKSGERVDITAKPSEGYELDAVVIQGKDDKDIKLNGDNKGLYFEASDRNVTITAKFRKVSAPQQFTDVLPNAWYYDSMDIKTDMLDDFTDAHTISGYAKDGMVWVCSEKIIQGNNGLLRPGGDTTRAKIAAVLHRFLNINVQG